MRNTKTSIAIMAIAFGFTACKKDSDPIIIIPPSTGAQVQFNGLAGTEAGSAAGNTVYLDLSMEKTTALNRFSWDLGFYTGSDFRVILNNTSSAGIKVLAKSDLSTVTAADTAGLTLAVSQTNPAPSDLLFFDDINGDLTKTAIPAISATDAENKVIIMNRGTGGITGNLANPRAWVKLRVLRNVSGGYTLQYAGITETGFKTLQVSKNSDYHFTLVSFDNGVVSGLPEKDRWDINWGYSVFQTDFGGGMVPYNFSDMISVNYLAGVTTAMKKYADATAATAAFAAFNKDSANNTTMVAGRWNIGSSWRSTQPATGANLDRFYIIKDPAGNYYKFKCLAMGVADGGTRGKPEFRYELIK